MTEKYNNDNIIKNQKILAYVKLVFLFVIVIGLPAYIWFFQHQLIDSVSSVNKVQILLNSNRMLSVPIYIGAQILQIVICIIPGQWLQMGAGLAWGFWLGCLYSIVGAAIGSWRRWITMLKGFAAAKR